LLVNLIRFILAVFFQNSSNQGEKLTELFFFKMSLLPSLRGPHPLLIFEGRIFVASVDAVQPGIFDRGIFVGEGVFTDEGGPSFGDKETLFVNKS
jgi:hypothetical protein